MRDEDFEYFISKFGEASTFIDADKQVIEQYRGILPDKLLEYWADDGWSGYAQGLFWVINPADYSDLLDMWLEDSPIVGIDNYHVIARSAFGKLYVWGQNTNQYFTLNCPMHAIIASEKELEKIKTDSEIAIQVFFTGDKEDYDLEDMNDKPLFDQALKKLGPLAVDEVYGFEPMLAAGGTLMVDNLAKLDLNIHLTILRQMAAPKLVSFG